MRTVQQLIIMFTMQEAMQVAQLGADWRGTPQNYGRAIAVEAAEAMDHVGYKWWKTQAIDMDQLRMEAIDMLHFEMCSALQEQSSLKEFLSAVNIKSIDRYFDESIPEFSKEELLKTLDELMIIGVSGQTGILPTLITLFKLCNLTQDGVFKLYIGKNVLNRFRKDNGYKDGSYIKEWILGEDNVHLTRILNELSADLPQFEKEIYKALTHDYEIVKRN